LLETLDLMYAAFIARRLGDAWTKEAGKIKKWLSLKGVDVLARPEPRKGPG